jgi:hypothetical protein
VDVLIETLEPEQDRLRHGSAVDLGTGSVVDQDLVVPCFACTGDWRD